MEKLYNPQKKQMMDKEKIKEFIDKWNVSYEDKEQQIEFALEMEKDLLNLIPKISDDFQFIEWKDFKKEPPTDKDKTYLFAKIIKGEKGKDIHNCYFIDTVERTKYFREYEFENQYTHYMEIKNTN